MPAPLNVRRELNEKGLDPSAEHNQLGKDGRLKKPEQAKLSDDVKEQQSVKHDPQPTMEKPDVAHDNKPARNVVETVDPPQEFVQEKPTKPATPTSKSRAKRNLTNG